MEIPEPSKLERVVYRQMLNRYSPKVKVKASLQCVLRDTSVAKLKIMGIDL